ncbi:unnamed protein product [Closterium sp. NIES-54]
MVDDSPFQGDLHDVSDFVFPLCLFPPSQIHGSAISSFPQLRCAPSCLPSEQPFLTDSIQQHCSTSAVPVFLPFLLLYLSSSADPRVSHLLLPPAARQAACPQRSPGVQLAAAGRAVSEHPLRG